MLIKTLMLIVESFRNTKMFVLRLPILQMCVKSIVPLFVTFATLQMHVHLDLILCILLWALVPCGASSQPRHNPEDESGSRVSGETRETLQQGTNHAAPDSWLRDATMGCYSVVLQNKIYVGTEYLGKTFSNWWVKIMQCQTRCYYRMLWCYNGIHTRRVGT